MVYTLQNEYLTVCISDIGAEICSVTDRSGRNWIWQGDPEFWEGHAPVLFPYCGRIWNSLCTVNGVPCSLGIHGFFMSMKTEGEQLSDSKAVFTLRSNEETLAQYPFAFMMKMTYTLDGRSIFVRAEITNTGTRVMPCGYGVHPGFCFFGEDQGAEEYYLEFSKSNQTYALRLDDSECYPIGGEQLLCMENGNRFHLPEGDLSAVLRDTTGEVTLACKSSNRSVTLTYPDFPYLTLWRPRGGAFVCIEPWTSIPSTFGKRTELMEKEDLIRIQAGMTASREFSMRFN